VTYANGIKKNDSVMIQVNDSQYAPQAIILTNPAISRRYQAVAGSAPLVVKFDARQSKDTDNNISRFSWDFDGDGVWDTEGSVVEYKYWKVGNFIAKLRVIDADGSDSTATVKIMVGEELPVIDFGASTVAGPAPLTIDFDASGSRLPQSKEIVSYSWDFNSESRDRYRKVFVTESAQTTHIFENIGEYIVKLVINAKDGTTYEDTLKVIATYPTLKAYFDVSRLSGKAPLAVSFDGSGSSGNIVKLEWVFNDGSVADDEKQVIHVFKEPGDYEVNLFIYDGFGNMNSYSRTIVVE
jgi:PKD repeat protein